MLLPSLQELPVLIADRPGSTGGRPLSAAQNHALPIVPGVRCSSLQLCRTLLSLEPADVAAAVVLQRHHVQ